MPKTEPAQPEQQQSARLQLSDPEKMIMRISSSYVDLELQANAIAQQLQAASKAIEAQKEEIIVLKARLASYEKENEAPNDAYAAKPMAKDVDA